MPNAETLPSVILVVDDEDIPRNVIQRLLTREGHTVLPARDGKEATILLETRDIDFVFTDLHMPNMDGMELLQYIRTHRPEVPVLVMTGFASMDTAINALRMGAFDYVTKPVSPEYVLHRLHHALEHTQMRREIRHLRRLMTDDRRSRLLGESPAMETLRDMIARVARNDITVLIEGETGTGKELVAGEVHRRSSRAARPFVAVNCGALTDTLLESELFGHVKGAFTGAANAKEGLFEAANGGTIFLDEIGEMSPHLQVRMLRVLEEREVLPVGGTRARAIDVRVVAATHRDLTVMADAGDFRQDLLFRLNIVTIEVPPLRNRREDIPLLAQHFLGECREQYRTQAARFSTEAIHHLISHSWPGNIRQLRNVVTRAAALHAVDELDPTSLPDDIVARPLVTRDIEQSFPTLEEMERQYIMRVLERTEGNRSDAATILGIDRSTLYRKCKTYDL